MIDHSRCSTITRSWLIGSTNVWSPTLFFCSLLFSHIKCNICIYTYMYILGMKYLYQERQKTLQATESYECCCIGCYHFVAFGTYIKLKKSVQHSMQFFTSPIPMRGFAIIETNPLSVRVDRILAAVTAGNLQENHPSVMQVYSTKLIIAQQQQYMADALIYTSVMRKLNWEIMFYQHDIVWFTHPSPLVPHIFVCESGQHTPIRRQVII